MSRAARTASPAPRAADRLAPLLALVFAGLLLCRRPAALLHADFWAEDGWRWYPDAYNQGWHSLLIPYAGYLQTICRLVALAAQPFPLLWAPTLFALAALCLQIATALLLASSRLDAAWPGRASRILFACIFLLLPNAFEVYANLTNAQWNLSLLGFLILVASPARSRTGGLLDLAALLLCGLSGPFCLFLLPVAAWQAHRVRRPDAWRKLAALAVCAALQASLAVAAGRGAATQLGAGILRLSDIVALQILLGTLIGRHGMAPILAGRLWSDQVLPVALILLAGMLSILALQRGSRLLRQFCLFATPLLAAGLLRPATGSIQPAWLLFSTPDLGDRYYVVPMLAWVGILLTLAADRNRSLRILGVGLLAMVLLSIPGDLHFATALATAPPTGFDAAARRFAAAPAGTEMAFPLHPQGAPPMRLTRH